MNELKMVITLFASFNLSFSVSRHPPALDNLPPYSVFFVRSGDEDGKEEVDILCSGTLIDWQLGLTH